MNGLDQLSMVIWVMVYIVLPTLYNYWTLSVDSNRLFLCRQGCQVFFFNPRHEGRTLSHGSHGTVPSFIHFRLGFAMKSTMQVLGYPGTRVFIVKARKFLLLHCCTVASGYITIHSPEDFGHLPG